MTTNKSVSTSGWDDYFDRVRAAVNKLSELGVIEPAGSQNADAADGRKAVWQLTGFGLDVIESMNCGLSEEDSTEIVNAVLGI